MWPEETQNATHVNRRGAKPIYAFCRVSQGEGPVGEGMNLETEDPLACPFCSSDC